MKKLFNGIKLVFKFVSKLFSVRTLIIILLIAVIALGLYFLGKGLGIGNGNGDGEGQGNTSVETSQDEASDVENDTVKEEVEIVKQPEDNNVDVFEGAIIKITVADSEYFYQNERITLDDFMDELSEIDSELVVEITDDNASLRAYDDLIDRLKEEHISYVEK